MLLFVLGFLLFVLTPLLFVFALIKPAKLHVRTKRNPTGRWSLKQFSLFLVATFFISIILMAIGAPSDTDSLDQTPDSKVADEEVVQTEVVEPVSEPAVSESVDAEPAAAIKETEKAPVVADKTFGMTLNEFGQQFMSSAKDLGLGDYSWDEDPELSKGAVNDTFTVKLSDAVAMNGIVDKNGELKGITYIMGKTDKGAEAGMNMLVMGGLTAKTLNPDLPQKQTSEVIGELMTSAAEEFEKTGSSTKSKVVGDVKYTVVASKMIGLWLSFEPA